jgi:diadenosine tetraphosphatase ApaH/serine/threonine PP2A family protein phosphatase
VRYLILSDIHSNWEALEAVLADAAGTFDEALCCGDLVGYGADPNRVVEWVRSSVRFVVRGNHDKGCAGLEDLDWFNPIARAAAEWTATVLTPGNLEYLRSLPRGPLPLDSFQILHGSPLDEDEYLLTAGAAAQEAPYLDRDVSFFGHTHYQGGFFLHRNGVRRIPQVRPSESNAVLALEHDAAYLINPGSVGQPRDGDPRAAYLVYDTGDRTVEYRRVKYDIARAQAKIRAAWLPELLAERLEVGN